MLRTFPVTSKPKFTSMASGTSKAETTRSGRGNADTTSRKTDA